MNDSEYFERFPNKETLEIILERMMENKGVTDYLCVRLLEEKSDE